MQSFSLTGVGARLGVVVAAVGARAVICGGDAIVVCMIGVVCAAAAVVVVGLQAGEW